MREDEVRRVADRAALAPSLHNTQPWRFVASPTGIDVYADRTRWLPHTDPEARQLHLSCGAAAELGRLAIRVLGHGCVVRLGPDAHDRDLLVKLHVFGSVPPSDSERRLLAAASKQHTVRAPHNHSPVSASDYTAMQQAASERFCWLRRVAEPDERTVLATLLDRAQSIQIADPGYHRELARWRSVDGRPNEGIPADAYATLERSDPVSNTPVRDLAGDGGPKLSADGMPPVQQDLVVVLGTDGDGPLDWLRAGRALANLLLTLTDSGLISQPLGPVTEVTSTRERLRQELGLLGFPQLTLRVGCAVASSGNERHAVDDVPSPDLRSAHDRRVSATP